jgi:protein CMS1
VGLLTVTRRASASLASVHLLSITLIAVTFFMLGSTTATSDSSSNTFHTMSDSGSEGGVPLLEAEFDTAASTKKRKRDVESETTKDSKKAAKKLKRKEKKKQKVKEIDEDDLDQELGVNHSFERMDGQLLADYFNARTRLYGKELSSVELEDRSIPGEFLAHLPNSWSDEGSEDYARQH